MSSGQPVPIDSPAEPQVVADDPDRNREQGDDDDDEHENIMRAAPQAIMRALGVVNLRQQAQPVHSAASMNTMEELDALEKELRPQVGEILVALENAVKTRIQRELEFLHSITPLKRTEYDAIEKDIQFPTKKAMLQGLQATLQMQQGGFVFPDAQSSADLTQVTEEALLKAAKVHLAPDAAEKYEAELTSRQAFRVQAGSELITAALDKHLQLRPDQRDAISALVREHWKDKWKQNLQLLPHSIQYLPKLPPQVRTVLKPHQIKVFDAIRTHDASVFFPGQWQGMIQVAADADVDDAIDFAIEEELIEEPEP